MLYAFIADIHGNIVALDAVLRAIDTLKPDKVYNLGDVVGYGARPSECIQRIQDRGIEALVGNHDLAALGILDISYFNLEAQESVHWTAKALTDDDRTYLKSLPLTLANDHFGAVHGSFPKPTEFDYILNMNDANRCFESQPYRLLFVAHSHVSVAFISNTHELWASMANAHQLADGVRVIVNVGSVGQPRDGDPRASFALFDSVNDTLDIIRIRYDIDAAAEMILETDLPKSNAYRLFIGR
jgi:diadenosine tetraphosphatase ApaH/serine/threonine PP2A family protein phosphatase